MIVEKPVIHLRQSQLVADATTALAAHWCTLWKVLHAWPHCRGTACSVSFYITICMTHKPAANYVPYYCSSLQFLHAHVSVHGCVRVGPLVWWTFSSHHPGSNHVGLPQPSVYYYLCTHTLFFILLCNIFVGLVTQEMLLGAFCNYACWMAISVLNPLRWPLWSGSYSFSCIYHLLLSHCVLYLYGLRLVDWWWVVLSYPYSWQPY